MVLDLAKLSSSQKINIDTVFKENQIEFNSILENILTLNSEFIYKITNISSRNNFQSDLYLNCVKSIFIKEELNRNQKINKVIVYNLNLYKHLKKIYQNVGIYYFKNKADTQINFFFKPYFNLIKIIRNSFYLLLNSDSKRNKKIIKEKKIILIDTFLLKNSIERKQYIDRYYNNILKFVDKKNKNKLFFCPTIRAKYSTQDLENIQNNSSENLIFKNDFLKFSDYVRAFFIVLRQRIKIKKQFMGGIDITDLILYTHRLNKYNFITYDALLNYFFVNRLVKNSIFVKTFIDWNENQSIDKSFIKGFKDFSPKTKIKSYQGYMLSYSYNFHLCPTEFEIRSRLVADEILVIGKKLKKHIKKFSNNINVSSAPAFRFYNYYKTIKNNQSDLFLIVLPIEITHTKLIIEFLISIFDDIKIQKNKVHFKLHPTINKNDFIKKYPHFTDLNFIDKKFGEIILDYKVVLGNSSSTLMESLMHGVPVINLPSFSGFDSNPIPMEIDNNIFRLCNDKIDVIKAIKHFNKNSKTKSKLYAKIAEDIRLNYFDDINFNSVQKFID